MKCQVSGSVYMSNLSLEHRFTGCLIGALIGDVIGAVVEGESAKYINKTYSNLDQIVGQESVPEILGGEWLVGRYTDDTQMSICVAEWLLAKEWDDGQTLLGRFSEAYRPARRYGSGARWILEAFPERKDEWQALATIIFPDGSYGNGSAMRASPIGLLFRKDWKELIRISEKASKTTHSHPRAIVGATLQAAGVALASRTKNLQPEVFLGQLQSVLRQLRWKTKAFRAALRDIEDSLKLDRPAEELFERIGTGIEAVEAVPASLYCFLANPDSYEDCLTTAILAGGDTDTIASMAGALSGTYLGQESIPKRWLARVKEVDYTVGRIAKLGRHLYALSTQIKSNAQR